MYMSLKNIMKNKIIYQILAKNLRISEDSINLETVTSTSRENSGNINVEIEKEFKIKVRNDQIGGLISIKKLIKHFIA